MRDHYCPHGGGVITQGLQAAVIHTQLDDIFTKNILGTSTGKIQHKQQQCTAFRRGVKLFKQMQSFLNEDISPGTSISAILKQNYHFRTTLSLFQRKNVPQGKD